MHWAAEAKQQCDWVLASIPTAWIINRNGMQKSPVDPLKIIPPQFRPPPEPVRPKTPEEAAEENRLGWVALDRFFGGR